MTTLPPPPPLSRSPRIANTHLRDLATDVLFHIGFSCLRDDRQAIMELFGDVQFFVAGGSVERMTAFAHHVAASMEIKSPFGYALSPVGSTTRYTLFKVGPVLIASHGIGIPSTLILLHEVTKLLEYAEAKDVVYIRMGTSGGIGIEPGTVVLTTEALNEQLEPFHESVILGKRVQRRSVCSLEVSEEIANAAQQVGMPVAIGKTLTSDDFYEAQGRLDGAICEFTLDDKLQYLETCAAAGVKNMEMEARGFAAFCDKLQIPCAVVCVTLVNRLFGDQVVVSPDELTEMESRPGKVLLQYIKSKLEAKKRD
jgi:uridine phosphorylase